MMAEAYGDKHDKFVYGLCRICGETAPFEPDVGWPIRRDLMFQSCPNGHMVKHPFVIDEHPVVRHAQKELEAAGTWTIG